MICAYRCFEQNTPCLQMLVQNIRMRVRTQIDMFQIPLLPGGSTTRVLNGCSEAPECGTLPASKTSSLYKGKYGSHQGSPVVGATHLNHYVYMEKHSRGLIPISTSKAQRTCLSRSPRLCLSSDVRTFHFPSDTTRSRLEPSWPCLLCSRAIETAPSICLVT